MATGSVGRWLARRASGAVYTAALVLAIAGPAAAQDASPADLAELRAGDMRGLIVHDAPRPLPDATFLTADGAEVPLSDFRGRYVLLNFWATWCGPCRKEMPSLDALSAEMTSDDFAVVPVASGPNPLPAIESFFADNALAHLPILRDPRGGLAAEMGVFAMPVTVLIDPEGREIARLTGEADWNGADARRVISAAVAGAP